MNQKIHFDTKPPFGISIFYLYFSKCLKWVEVRKIRGIWDTNLPYTHFREVEANCLKMKCPISGPMKLELLALEKVEALVTFKDKNTPKHFLLAMKFLSNKTHFGWSE